VGGEKVNHKKRTLIKQLDQLPENSMVKICGWLAVSNEDLIVRDFTGAIIIKDIDEKLSSEIGSRVEVKGLYCGKKIMVKELSIISRSDLIISNDKVQSIKKYRQTEHVNLLWQINIAEQLVRGFLLENNFIEIRTPILWEPPVREYGQLELEVVHPEFHNSMYSLLQSPLVPSLLIAIGGLERTFQFSRCFRWDPEGDDNTRSLEFNQLHLTMAFTSMEEGREFSERLISHLINNLKGEGFLNSFSRITYDESIMKFGNDRPDFRYNEILTPIIYSKEIINSQTDSLFQGVLVKSLLPEFVLRTMLETLSKYFENVGIMTMSGENVKKYGNIHLKNFKAWISKFNIKSDVTLFMLQPKSERYDPLIKAFCRQLAKYLNQSIKEIGIGWVENFPYLFKMDELNEKELKYLKHFSRSLFGRTYKENGKIYLRSHDLILNGVEIASGGEKEHDALKFKENLIVASRGANINLEDYNYYIEALQNGAPPLYTIAFGWERLMSQIFKTDSIYDLIIFPKDGAGRWKVIE